MSIKEASVWASEYLGKTITTSNISYLIQYGRIRKIGMNGSTLVSVDDLVQYYNELKQSREISWKTELGKDLNWALSFDQYKESETTKHVHRLHPYKGKFIPQLAEYFLDSHIDSYKKETYFKPGDIVLDPFSGSGTTMVQASELGLHSIGIDISAYCTKHGKICKPLFSILKWWQTYTKDTINRLIEFAKTKKDTHHICLTGDSRTINITQELGNKYPEFAKLVHNQKISGIFSSPPYVGMIDYHEQHAYAYDLFGFKRQDELEIGPLYKGQGRDAKESYIEGIVFVLNNCKQYLIDDYNIFLVANDKHNLYPVIAEKANMEIVNKYKRPVLNRTEKDKGAYAEIIFHLKKL